MKVPPRVVVAVWLALVVVCAGWLYRNLSIGTDLTVFLPPSTNPAQRMLVQPAARRGRVAADPHWTGRGRGLRRSRRRAGTSRGDSRQADCSASSTMAI